MSADDDLELLAERMDFDKAAEMDEQLPDDKAADIALRKLVSTLGSDPEETEVGIIEATYRTVHIVDDLATRLSRLEDQVDKMDRDVHTAKTVAKNQAKPGGGVTKKRVAELKSRNELVRAAALKRGGKAAGHSVKVAEVQDMAKPDTVLYYQTVKDAWDNLAASWDCLAVEENEQGDKVLRLDGTDIDPALVKTVESELDRDDLAKRLLSQREREGV